MPITIPERLGDFATAVALGTVRNTNGNPYVNVERFMHRESVSTTEEGLWNGPGDFFQPTAGHRVRIRAGGDAADAGNGAGARTVLVSGTDTTGAIVTDVLTTQGAAASDLSNVEFFRVNEIKVLTVGTYGGGNVGAVSLETQAGNLWLTIDILENVSHHGHIAIPTSHSAVLLGVMMHIESGKAVDFTIWARPNGYDVTGDDYSPAFVIRTFAQVDAGLYTIPFVNPRVLTPGADFWATAKTIASTSAASLLFEYRLVPAS